MDREACTQPNAALCSGSFSPAGIAAIQSLGTQKNWQVDTTEDPSLFTAAVLDHYDVVIFMSTTGDVLDGAQQTAFENYIKSGKGYVGIHAASDGDYDWRWYGNLVGAYFRNHPAGTPTATVVTEDTTDPSTQGLPARWSRVDEWYNYKAPSNANGDDNSPRGTPGVHVLLKMDESTYAEDDGSDGVDDDHPISWCRRYDGGRSWYTGLGHTQASFAEAGILSHIGAGIEIAAGVLPSAACGVAPPTGGGTDVEVPIGGTVPGVLALTFGAAPSLGTFMPGMTKDSMASVAASVTSSAAAADLTVRDPSATATGRLVNGALAMPQALQVRADEGAFAPLSATGAALTLAAWSTPVGARPVTVEFKQSVAATDSLLTGSYGKTLTFTLSATTP